MFDKKIPKSVLERLPIYLHYLHSLGEEIEFISSTKIANELKLGEVQVRKDLSLISGIGRPKIGYLKLELINHLNDALDVKCKKDIIIVGFGRIGQALLKYEGFKEFGLEIQKAFDIDLTKTNQEDVLPLESLEDYIKTNNIELAIISVEEKNAQEVCDLLVKCGIKGIWNFAPVNLTVPNNVKLKNENMAASLAVLAASIKNGGINI